MCSLCSCRMFSPCACWFTCSTGVSCKKCSAAHGGLLGKHMDMKFIVAKGGTSISILPAVACGAAWAQPGPSLGPVGPAWAQLAQLAQSQFFLRANQETILFVCLVKFISWLPPLDGCWTLPTRNQQGRGSILAFMPSQKITKYRTTSLYRKWQAWWYTPGCQFSL